MHQCYFVPECPQLSETQSQGLSLYLLQLHDITNSEEVCLAGLSADQICLLFKMILCHEEENPTNDNQMNV